MANLSTPIVPQLIVGLGNPGSKYDKTRHNVGFDVIEALARRWHVSLSEHRKFQGLFGEGLAPNRARMRLLKPTTYMNLSGQSIRAVTDWFKLPPESVLVIYDDMDLPVGRLRLRLSGSAGGQKGMKSAIAHLGTQDFPRLRLGIGNPKTANADKDTISHVLGQFSKAEAQIMAEVVALACDAIELSLKDGVAKAMSLYNNRDLSVPAEDPALADKT
ncbi:MAG: aminoacyl-tRNA hydrolase [Kaiparowitsia implicata GSE-PSE-MK54-09C]|jgi:PTH1 family peptidyl-tRNA hydrolase|nr:aminoacyl-tRNA hydrolase [Kaiparowitsia implicata GSE-PSE-MK54-09C]